MENGTHMGGSEHFPLRGGDYESLEWEYVLGGLLVGSHWHFTERDTTDEAWQVYEGSESHHGETVRFPMIRFKYTKYNVSVSGFVSKLEMGHFEPKNLTAERIVAFHEDRNLRKLRTNTE